MADEKQLKRLKKSVEGWNKWREKNPGISIDLTEASLYAANLREAYLYAANLREAYLYAANLRGANLREANLTEANLTGANLREANLTGANLTGANLREADLTGANLWRAYLWRAYLRRADLTGASLWRAILWRADLTGASLWRAHLYATSFVNVDLSSTLHLDDINFIGPCYIDNKTLIKSKDLPYSFLMGCGLSDWEIESAKLFKKDLSNDEIIDITYKIIHLREEDPLQMHSLFISYSNKDTEFVDYLQKRFDALKIKSWRDVHDAPAGPLERIIDRQISVEQTVLIVFSENAVASDWVEFEIRKARKLEKKLFQDEVERLEKELEPDLGKEGAKKEARKRAKDSAKSVLCPISLDDSWKDCPFSEVLMNQVQRNNILSFADWRDKDKFDQQLRRLIEGLDLFYKKPKV